MKERPILFSAPMVRAILDGTKTQTRRVVKQQPEHWQDLQPMWGTSPDGVPFGRPGVVRAVAPDWPDGREDDRICPYGQPGDQLWVRETWAQPTTLDPGPTVYRADYPACVPAGYQNIPPADAITWKPSIHMPRALSRILLEVTGVRVERLNDCSEADARAEGVDCIKAGVPTDRDAYRYLWEEINGAGSWAANPWVWVVEFKRVEALRLAA